MVNDRECYRVGDLILDVRAMRVSRNGVAIPLPPLSFELLVNLVRRAPDVVSRQDLLEATWKDIVVGPETLKQRVKLLRESLDDDPHNPRYIATIRGRGYQMIVDPVSLAGLSLRGRVEDCFRRLLSRATSTKNGRIGILCVGITLVSLCITGIPAEVFTFLL